MCWLKTSGQISASVGHAVITDAHINFLLSLGTYKGSLLCNSGTQTSVMRALVDICIYCVRAHSLMDSFTTKHMTACKKAPDFDPCRHPAEVVLTGFIGRTLC